MPRHIYILLFLFTTSVAAQSPQQNYVNMEAFYNAQNYTDCVEKCNELLLQYPKDDTAYWNVLSFLAYSKFFLQDYPNACTALRMERDLRKKFQGVDNEFYISVTYSLGIFCSYTGGYAESIEMMEEARPAMENLYGASSEYYTGLLRSLASVYNMAGSDYLAEKTYDTLYAIVKANYDPGDPFHQTVANEASTFYTTSGRFEKSEPFFLDAVAAMENAYGKDNDNFLITFNSLGEFYIYAGWYEKAEKVYAEFVTLCAKHYGKKSADHATSINNLAVAYEKQGKNAEAEKCYLEALKIKAEVYSTESDFYALTLQNLAVLYDNMSRYAEAEKLLNEAIRIYERVYGAEHENYATALNNMSSIYSSNGRWDKAIEIQRKACDIQKASIGENSVGYLNSLGNLAQLYFEKGDIDSADLIMSEAAGRKKIALGENHPDYAITLYNLGNIKTFKGEFRLASELYDAALAIQEKTIGPENEQYATTLTSMAGLYMNMGDYYKAEKTYIAAAEIMSKSLGERNPEYATVMANIGLLYIETGQLDKAESCLNTALTILQDAYGIDHPDNIYALTSLAQVYIERNYYEKADNYLMKALEIARNYFGENHSNYTSTLNTLASLYTELGQFDKAEKFYKEGLERNALIYGESHPEYISGLSNIATLYMERAQYSLIPSESQADVDKAQAYLMKALKADTLAGRENHSDHAIHLNNLAELYRRFGFPDEAEKLLLKSIELEEKIYGSDYIGTAISLYNLALVYEGQKQWDKALEYCERAVKIKRKVFGPESSNLINQYLSIAVIYQRKGMIKEAYDMFQKALTLQLEDLNRNLGFLTEQEKAQYFKVNGSISQAYYLFLIGQTGQNSIMNDLGYEAALKEKGVLLRSSEKLKYSIQTSGDPDLIELYGQWIGKRQEIARLLTIDQTLRDVAVETIETEADALEKELITRSSVFRSQFGEDISLEKIKLELAPTEAAVEFVQYNEQDSLGMFYTKYAAMILKHGDIHPSIVAVCSENDLWDKMNASAGSNEVIAKSIYGEMDKTDGVVYKLLWQPLEKELAGIKTIYYSPVGLLHKVSFSAMRSADGVYISDKFQLMQVTTTAGIHDLKSSGKITPTDNVCVFGGAQFSSQKTESEIWSYLEGTKNEADQIHALAVSSKLDARKFIGTDASEGNFKDEKISGSSEILHIATHGFFYQFDTGLQADVTETSQDLAFRGAARGVTTFVKNPNPLMRSGLVFTGANDVWNASGNLDTAVSEDGVLTAMEVANLNLESTKLVVLSACETGLGDIAGTQGVYGLQRAFKMAGVDKMIMSLWQVPDKETAEFMVLFYQNLFKLNDVHLAFSKAQAVMRSKYAPYYWAAFVLVE